MTDVGPVPEVQGTVPAAPPRHAPPGRPGLRRSTVDGALVVVLSAVAVLVLHRAWDVLPFPYWLDEAWVALSAHLPLRDLPTVTATTPLGWTFLLRLPGLLPGDWLRLLPLAFHAAAVVAAHALGRSVQGDRARPRLAGLLFAAVVATAPFLLERDDLKPYTADAFVVVLVLLLVAGLDRRWSGRRLWVLAGVSSVAMLVSHTAAFVSAAAMLAVLLTQLARGYRQRARQCVLAGLCAAAVLGTVFVLAVRPSQNDALAHYWVDYYLPTDLGGALAFLGDRAGGLPALFALGSWWVLGPLLVAGLVVLAVRRLTGVLATVLLLVVLALSAGAVKAYPLLDQRTSTYLYAAVAVVLAAGVLGLASLLARARRSLALLVVLPYALAVAVGAVPASAVDISREDVRAQVRYLDAVRGPGDVVLVGYASSFAYAYYSPDLPATITAADQTAIGYTVSFPATSRVVVIQSREPVEVRRAVQAACRMAGPGGRVWRAHTHLAGIEARVYEELRRERAYTVVATRIPRLDMLTCVIPGRSVR